MSTAVRILAPAKVNLALAVGPPGSGGMHPISSWMLAVNLCDELLVTRLPDDRLSRYAILWHDEAPRRSDIDWSITRDLAVRAHHALEAHVGRRLPVQLRMDKRIPVGGGLGGGSADAAAMLRAVDALFELGLPDGDLEAIAATLGSDVPFLLHGGSAIVGGLGEQLERHAAAPDPAALFNDLAPAAARLAPELGTLGDAFTALAERPAHVTGSGSTLFVVADDPLHAEFLARAVRDQLAVPAAAVTAHAAPRPLPVVDQPEATAATASPPTEPRS
jgi:4-diphosphocytidyl-2-C-methyl-D-erythritol kinase